MENENYKNCTVCDIGYFLFHIFGTDYLYVTCEEHQYHWVNINSCMYLCYMPARQRDTQTDGLESCHKIQIGLFEENFHVGWIVSTNWVTKIELYFLVTANLRLWWGVKVRNNFL